MTALKIQAIKSALSNARMSTYENALDATGKKITSELALDLYAWNANVSATMLAPLHICEVVIRNAVANALEIQYGHRWPWSAGFEKSLPNPSAGYNPRRDLQIARGRVTTTGKLIPELKFVFWQKMFTSRYDSRLWDTFLVQVFPNIPTGQTTKQTRAGIYNELEHIRLLRNRIAHHEPIFSRNLADDYKKIYDLISLKCPVTVQWMDQNQQVKGLIGNRPFV